MRKILLLIVPALFLCVQNACAQKWSIGTNSVLWADGGSANAEMHYSVARHWSLNAGATYNNWDHKQRSFSAGARWWPWNVYSGWWMGAGAQYKEFSEVDSQSDYSREGDDYGARFNAGYTLMLKKQWNLELGLGMRAGYRSYTVYDCPRCGRVVEQGEKVFLIPDMANLSVIYVF